MLHCNNRVVHGMSVMPKLRKALPPPRVRKEPPTIEEAVSAAQGLTSEIAMQIEIAAGLMGVSEDEIRPFVSTRATRSIAIPMSGRRAVVVERRSLRPVTTRRTVSVAGG